MTSRGFLIDTNVVVYARDPRATEKRACARRILRESAAMGTGFLSTQVLVETFDVLVRGFRGPRSGTWDAKRSGGLSREAAASQVGRLARAFTVLPAEEETVLLAAGCARTHGLRIFDAMLWASAFRGGLGYVLSEDLPHRSKLEGVAFIDPFAADLGLEELGLEPD